MKLPRWLVFAMLTTSVLSVLAAAGWWWVTWPERTAREFVEWVCSEFDREPTQRIVFEFQSPPELCLVELPNGWADVIPQSRALLDVMRGHQRFMVKRRHALSFDVARGSVIRPLPDDIYFEDVGIVNMTPGYPMLSFSTRRGPSRLRFVKQDWIGFQTP